MVKLPEPPKAASNGLPKAPGDFLQPHFTMSVVGKMKSGKSSLSVRLIKSYPEGFWTHKYVIAPTATSQQHYWDFIGVPREHVFT
eukprot:22950-Eustigmatos_ZCMA.PRE.1